jgi:hypothetical protein
VVALANGFEALAGVGVGGIAGGGIEKKPVGYKLLG